MFVRFSSAAMLVLAGIPFLAFAYAALIDVVQAA